MRQGPVWAGCRQPVVSHPRGGCPWQYRSGGRRAVHGCPFELGQLPRGGEAASCLIRQQGCQASQSEEQDKDSPPCPGGYA